MPADLDTRLRSALRLPEEPVTSDAARAALLSALPRYRARRRIGVATAGAAVLAVIGLSIGVVVGTSGPAPRGSASGQRSGRTSPLAGPACVEVRVGSAPPACEGSPMAVPGADDNRPLGSGQASPSFATATPSSAASGVRAGAGIQAVVSLPRTPGVEWSSVTIAPEAGGAARRVAATVQRATGRTVAVLPTLPSGTYEVSARGTPECRGTAPCTSKPMQWSITLVVT